jgi:hypothetical protein
VDIDALIARHPRLLHMTEAGSWPQIERHGLLSTSALLDLYGVRGERRAAIESRRRPENVELSDPGLGRVLIRDNVPLRERHLHMLPGTTEREYCELLNGKVFFWLSEERLQTLIGARLNRGRAHDVLTLDTAALLARHGAAVSLTAINTGSTLYPSAPARGRETFVPVARFDFDAARRRRGPRNAIAELTVDRAVPDVLELLVAVERRRAGESPQTLWTP